MSSPIHKGRAERAYRAVVFDVFGTLAKIDDPFLRKRVPSLLGVSPREWLRTVRDSLLRVDLVSLEGFVEYICTELADDAGRSRRAECRALVEKCLSEVELFQGVLPLIRFLRRRGFKLGIVSNLSSAHAVPLQRLGVLDAVDAAALSFRVGRIKPDPEIYASVCGELEIEPGDALMVGDSLLNDVRAPAALGFATLYVGDSDAVASVPRTSDLGWLALCGSDPLRPLLEVGDELELGSERVVVHRIDPVADCEQGRYNLVWRVEVSRVGEENAGTRTCFAKRYRFSESAYVEDFARRVMREAGFEAPAATVVEGPEPALVSQSAVGKPYENELNPAIAAELARHMVFAYVFANADIRPRNAYIDLSHGRSSVTMIDLEHCFLNRAIDVKQLPDPTDPSAIDGVGVEKLKRMTRRYVLSDRALRRARGEFLDTRTAAPEIVEAYRIGWMHAYRDLSRKAERLVRMIETRVYEDPPLIVGTSRYRRAMAEVDVQDIRDRLGEDPADVLERVLG